MGCCEKSFSDSREVSIARAPLYLVTSKRGKRVTKGKWNGFSIYWIVMGGNPMATALTESVQRIVTPVAKRVLLTWERLESGVSFDLTSREVRSNPYEIYELLRRERTQFTE